MKLRKQLFANADKPKQYKEDYGDDEVRPESPSVDFGQTRPRADPLAPPRPQSDLDDEWIQEHEKQLVVLEGEKIRKKFERENTKRETEGEKPLPESELKERLKAVSDVEKQIKHDRKVGYEETRMSEDRIATALQKLDERIQVAKTNATDKDEGKGAAPLPSS